MSKQIATVQDKDGEVWTGKVERESPDLMDLVVGVICPPMLLGTLSSSDKTTVVTNGERHTGKKI
jgi:hypothetical protein